MQQLRSDVSWSGARFIHLMRERMAGGMDLTCSQMLSADVGYCLRRIRLDAFLSLIVQKPGSLKAFSLKLDQMAGYGSSSGPGKKICVKARIPLNTSRLP